MPERPYPNEDFERHPDVRGLQGIQGPHHESLQSKLDLFRDAPVLARLADVPVDSTMRISSISGSGEKEEITFRRYADVERKGLQKPQWVLVRQEGEDYIEEPVIMHGACASPSGNLLEADANNRSVRQYAYFTYAVVYPLWFRHGSEVPDTPYADYRTPEEQVAPDVIQQYLAARDGYIALGDDGLLYYNTIDHSKSYVTVTGQVTSVDIEPLA